MDGDVWKYISPDARSLSKGLLTVDPKKRLTLDDLFRSPWIHSPTCRSHNNNVGCAITMTPISPNSTSHSQHHHSIQFPTDVHSYSGHATTVAPGVTTTTSASTATSSSHCIERHLKQTFNAFHTVTRDGGMKHLKDMSSTIKPATIAANGCACIPLPAATAGYIKTQYPTDSSSLLSTCTDKNTVSITPTQSTCRNASSNSLKNHFLPSTMSHDSRRRFIPDISKRYQNDMADISRVVKKSEQHPRMYHPSPASSPTRGNSVISTPNEALTGKIQQQLLNISPVPSNTVGTNETISSENSLFNFGGARVQDYLNTLSQIQLLQDSRGCSSSNSLSENNSQGTKMSTSSSSPSYSPKRYSSQTSNQQNSSRSCSSNNIISNTTALPFSSEQNVKIINCSSSSGGSSSNGSSNSSSRSGSSSNILSSNNGTICNNVMEGIRGVSYHHLTSSVSTSSAQGVSSSKYRLPSRYPSSSCPGSNNSSISSPYSPSSQLNSHLPHLSNRVNSGNNAAMVASNATTEILRCTPPAIGIDVGGANGITARPPSCSPVDLTSTSKFLPLCESSSNDSHRLDNIRNSRNATEKSKIEIGNSASLISVPSTRNGGPLTRSRKRKMGGDSDQSANIHLNMPTAKNASVTITLQVNSASSSSSSASNNDDDEGMSNNSAQIVPNNRATAPKVQRRGYFDEMPISRLGLTQSQNQSTLAMMSSNLSSQSFCGSEAVNSSTTTTAHAALAVLAATDTSRLSSGGSDEHIHTIRSAFASMPTSITAAAATAGGGVPVGLGCRGNAAVTITID